MLIIALLFLGAFFFLFWGQIVLEPQTGYSEDALGYHSGSFFVGSRGYMGCQRSNMCCLHSGKLPTG